LKYLQLKHAAAEFQLNADSVWNNYCLIKWWPQHSVALSRKVHAEFHSGLLFLINYICQLDEIKFSDSPSTAGQWCGKMRTPKVGWLLLLRGLDIQLVCN